MSPHLCHVIDSLAQGGAETLVCNIIENTSIEHTVCYFKDNHALVERVRDAGGTTVDLEQSFPYDVRSVVRLFQVLRRHDPDLLHAHLPYARSIGRPVGTVTGVGSIVTTYHNPIIAERGMLSYYLEPIVGRTEDVSVTVSDGIRRGFAERFPGRNWRTIHNGIDVTEFARKVENAPKEELRSELSIDEGTAMLVTVGRYVPQKSQKTLIRAMPEILDERPDTHLLVVGWGPLESELRATATELGISRSVTITGRVPTVHEYYALADLFVISSSYEGFGIVAVEAMAAGLPVVGTDVTGLEEIIVDGETGYLVPPNDPGAFADGVSKILSSKEFDSFGRRGYEHAVERFDICRVTEEYLELYETVISS